MRARDAANHVSELVSSSGFVTDTTPPVRVTLEGLGTNLISDGSFEDSLATGNCTNSMTSWATESDSCACVSKDPYAQDGNKLLVLQGNITQWVQVPDDATYQLVFYTSVLATDRVMKSSNEGIVTINGETHIFMLYNKPNVDVPSWQSHKFLLMLRQGNQKLKIGTLYHSAIKVDNVTLQAVYYSDENQNAANSHVQAHAVFLHDWSSIHADWHFIDEESGVVEHLWAIGLCLNHINTSLSHYFCQCNELPGTLIGTLIYQRFYI